MGRRKPGWDVKYQVEGGWLRGGASSAQGTREEKAEYSWGQPLATTVFLDASWKDGICAWLNVNWVCGIEEKLTTTGWGKGGGGWRRVEFNDPQHHVCFQQGEGAVQVHQGRRWSLWGWNAETSAGGGGQGGGQATPQVLDDWPQRAIQNTHPGLLQTEVMTSLGMQYRTHILASSKQSWPPPNRGDPTQASMCSTQHTSWSPPNRDDPTQASVCNTQHTSWSPPNRDDPTQASMCSTQHTSWSPPNRDDPTQASVCSTQHTSWSPPNRDDPTQASVCNTQHTSWSPPNRDDPTQASVCSTQHTSWSPPNRDDPNLTACSTGHTSWPHSDLTLGQAGASRSLGAGWPVSVCSTELAS